MEREARMLSLKVLFMTVIAAGGASVLSPVSLVAAQNVVESESRTKSDRFVGLSRECSGVVLEALHDYGGDLLIVNRKSPLSGVFPVVQMELVPGGGREPVTICATKDQILRSIEDRKKSAVEAEEWDRNTYRGLAMMTAQMEWDSLPPEQKTAETEKRILRDAEDYVRDKMQKLEEEFVKQLMAMDAAVEALDAYEKEKGAIIYRPAPPGSPKL